MSTQPTNLPVPSESPRDLKFNAGKFDEVITSFAEWYVDRFGQKHYTIEGLKALFDARLDEWNTIFQQFLESSGYEFLGDYEDGPLTFTSRNQYIRYDGQYWKLNAATDIPFTTTGTDATSWASDVTHFALIDGDTLRQELASSATNNGADLVNTTIDVTVGEIIRAPAIITGRVNIRNPKWNAPRDNAEDPAAATANAAAINMMLSSGAKDVELDDKARRVNSPLLYRSSMSIHGAGRSSISLVWTGGDLPVIARPTYSDKDAMGFSNVRLQDLRITDQAAARVSYYTVDLTNGNSNGLEGCMIDGPGNFDGSGNRIITSDRFGVILGRARNSVLANTYGFVSHFRDSRIVNSTLVMNTTDWYINSSELWGAFRNRSLEITGGGTIDGGTQIVPGNECGIFLTSDFGYDIATLKILGVYFDGSTDKTLYTGDAIKSDGTTGLVGARIICCNFDLMGGRGIYLNKANYTTIQGNIFSDCDAADAGLPDISIASMFGSKIDNTHHRETTAPKTGNARVNLGRPFVITGVTGFPISSAGGECAFSSTYQRSTVTNPQMVRSTGGSSQTSFDYGSTLPSAQNRYGEVILFGGRSKYSNGTDWLDLSDDLNNLSSATNMNSLTKTAKYYASDITLHTNIPVGITGPAKIDVGFIDTGYVIQELTLLKASGGLYARRMVNTVWTAWDKIA